MSACLVYAISAHAQSDLQHAERLAHDRRFGEAEAIYRAALDRDPRSRDARIGLARVLLWQLRLGEARTMFAKLVRERPGDADAIEGLATADYWSGDYRAAARGFRRVLAMEPSRDAARRSLAGIESAARPGYRVAASAGRDTQPLDAIATEARFSAFSDPLTRWDVRAGTLVLDADSARETLPFASIHAGVPRLTRALDAEASVAWQRFGDGSDAWLPAIALAWRRGRSQRIRFRVDRAALLATATALASHPTRTATSIAWSAGDRAEVAAESLRYFDGNRGAGAHAWWLSRDAAVRIGFSAGWRDTEESRFRSGVYDPYWTPQDLAEARAIVVARFAPAAGVALTLHVDGGYARERVTGSFIPSRIEAALTRTLSGAHVLTITARQERTAFYRTTSIDASVGGRF